MKTVKINFCNFWNSFDNNDNMFVNILKKHFNIEISDEPDFVIASNRGVPFEYMKYDCVRIMLISEPFSEDFTAFDYCIGNDYLDFGDRYFRLPYAFQNMSGKPWIPETITKENAEKILQKKKYFANFIYSHPSAGEIREGIFKKLEEYKPVISPGKLLNNTQPLNKPYKRISYPERSEFINLSKFTISAENVSYKGYVTEKIISPFMLNSIPIYYGDPSVYSEFNKDSFIRLETYDEKSLEKMMGEVEYLDTHDDAYIEMLMQCPFKDPDYLVKKYDEFEKFLVNIFSQEPDEAYRRVRFFCAKEYEDNLKVNYEHFKKISNRNALKKKIKRLLK